MTAEKQAWLRRWLGDYRSLTPLGRAGANMGHATETPILDQVADIQAFCDDCAPEPPRCLWHVNAECLKPGRGGERSPVCPRPTCIDFEPRRGPQKGER